MTTLSDERRPVTGGIDTHADVHVAAVVDETGRILGTEAFAADRRGYRRLLRWMAGHGRLERVGVEGTGTYGAGVARFLAAAGVEVVEVDRPNRQLRRRRGKSDPVDAESAARAALSGQALGEPKSRTGPVEGIRALRVARRSAIRARTQAINQLHGLVTSAPDELRARLTGIRGGRLVAEAARLRPSQAVDATSATKIALRSLAGRIRELDNEIARLDAALGPLVAATAPNLLALNGVGTDVAGALLVTAGDNPQRLRSEAAFAHLCGAAPIPASSGRTNRHRLNRGGDRQANNALWRIVLVRMSNDPRTRAYVERRTKEGLTKREIMRCLKRYVAREIYAVLA